MAAESYGIRPTTERDIAGLIELSRLVYPADVYRSEELRLQLVHFPAGQFVALSTGSQVVGMSSCLQLRADRFAVTDDWITVTGGGTLSTHDPHGDLLYGVDTMVHPEWRRNGIGTDLVLERFRLARALGVRYIRTGIRLAGYGAVSDVLTPAQYVSLVIARRMSDPALSFMLKFGFKRLGVSEHYLQRDPESAGAAAILEYTL